jgi:adenosylcobinamide-GDP ribazoletransferase
MTAILTAFRFLTIFPLGKGGEVEPRGMAAAMAWFPAVGLALGLMLYGCDRIFQHLLNQEVADILLIALLAVFSGALHLDGFADTLDGIYGGRGDKTRILAIMKDSRTGAIGVVGLVILLMMKYECLESVGWNMRAAALIVTPMVARWSQVLMAFGSKYARSEGSLAQPFVEHLELGHFMIATATTAIVLVFAAVKLASPAVLFIMVAAGVFALLSRMYFLRKIGGVTGDTIGAVSETCEVLVLLGFVVAGM